MNIFTEGAEGRHLLKFSVTTNHDSIWSTHEAGQYSLISWELLLKADGSHWETDC